MDYRTIAIIAHVDHGKTTLVDAMLKQSGTFHEREVIGECVMDSNDLERERGITIYAKVAAIKLGEVKVNIVDTPGHADFGSEVERVLRMVDGVLLVVDAAEGPMPQTRFVLRKSLELGLKPIVVINKIDKPAARPDVALNQVFDLFVELGANDAQLDFPYIYSISREGIAKKHLEDTSTDLKPLFDLILEKVPQAKQEIEAPMRVQPANLKYDSYVGRLGLGRIYEGVIKPGMNVTRLRHDGSRVNAKITHVYTHQGLKTIEVSEAYAGDIVQFSGISDLEVGETIAEDANATALPTIAIDPPTLTMQFLVNSSPFAGREGTLLTSRHIRERLLRELETNVGLQVEFSDNADVFEVSGRGELHLSVLIETMRREGFELQVSQPRVVLKQENGQTMEPFEQVVVDVPDASAGTVIEKLSRRKAEMTNMKSENGVTRIEFLMPTRGLLGYRSEFITDTKGEGTLSHLFAHYGAHKGEISRRLSGSMISGETGVATAYSLENLEQRGVLFVGPATEVYEGMVIGMSSKETMTVNPTKEKKLTNMRSAGAEALAKLTPPLEMTLERALEYIDADEYAEITPTSIRIRKKHLKETDRRRADKEV